MSEMSLQLSADERSQSNAYSSEQQEEPWFLALHFSFLKQIPHSRFLKSSSLQNTPHPPKQTNKQTNKNRFLICFFPKKVPVGRRPPALPDS